MPIIITGTCSKHKRFFQAIDEYELRLINNANRQFRRKSTTLNPEDFLVPFGPKSKDLLARNVNFFLDVFTPRQRLYLLEAKELLAELPEAHRLWMTLLLSTSLEFNSLLCGYKGAQKRRPGAVRHVFSHHAYSFPHTALENNPVAPGKNSGSLNALFQSRIVSATGWAQSPKEREYVAGKWIQRIIDDERDAGIEVFNVDDFQGNTRHFIADQRDSSILPLADQDVDFIVTDPPYFDSVQYSDLSHFFRCWLRWLQPEFADWDYGIHASAVSQSNGDAQGFGNLLGAIWSECNRVLKRPHGRLIFTYHHWQVNAWVQLAHALLKANMKLSAAYVVHSENPISVHIRHLKALKHDCILVLRPDDVNADKDWLEPSGRAPEDSKDFCRRCAQTLGWVLQTSPVDEEIVNIWKKAIGE